MPPDRPRLLRLRRLERLREIEKLALVRRSAQAEGILAQLSTLVERTERLAGKYAARADAEHGAALRQQIGFALGLRAIHCTATAEAGSTQTEADALLREIAAAEQRRSIVGKQVEQNLDDLVRQVEASASAELARKLNRSRRC